MLGLLYLLFPFNFILTQLYRIKDMYGHVSERSGLKAPLIADDVYEIIMKVLVWQTNIVELISIEFSFSSMY